jgi:DNA-directed RNA polymerase subunit RPC12/RpoP
MSDEVMSIVKCQDCGDVLDKVSNTEVEKGSTCPLCGSKSGRFEIVMNETLEMHEKIKLKAKDKNKKKPVIEYISGDDFHRKSGKWNSLERVIDRQNDKYKEVITNSRTGEFIRYCEEPLSKHQGHGSAKEKRSS